jgi:hypothetical protein
MDDDRAGLVFFDAASYSARESGGLAAITLRRSGGVSGPVLVTYTTVDGSARAGIDYVASAATLTFRPGQAISTFYIPLIDNTRADGARTFSIALSSPTPSVVLGPAATVTIVDDDAGGVIEFHSQTFTASATTGCATPPCDALLFLERVAGVASDVTVDFATVDGTGDALTDYVPTAGTITFNAGDTGATIRIPLRLTARPGRTFSVLLSSPHGGASLGPWTTATVTLK